MIAKAKMSSSTKDPRILLASISHRGRFFGGVAGLSLSGE